MDPRIHSGAFAALANQVLGAEAFTVGRRIFLSPGAAAEIARATKSGKRILAHEREHVRQYFEIGIARFLRVYLAEYFRARLSGAGHGEAYASIRFEREAFSAGDRCATGAGSFPDGGGDRTMAS